MESWSETFWECCDIFVACGAGLIVDVFHDVFCGLGDLFEVWGWGFF